MITIRKKRKKCKVHFHGEINTKFSSFEPEHLVMISKCVSMKYYEDIIILNIP